MGGGGGRKGEVELEESKKPYQLDAEGPDLRL